MATKLPHACQIAWETSHSGEESSGNRVSRGALKKKVLQGKAGATAVDDAGHVVNSSLDLHREKQRPSCDTDLDPFTSPFRALAESCGFKVIREEEDGASSDGNSVTSHAGSFRDGEAFRSVEELEGKRESHDFPGNRDVSGMNTNSSSHRRRVSSGKPRRAATPGVDARAILSLAEGEEDVEKSSDGDSSDDDGGVDNGHYDRHRPFRDGDHRRTQLDDRNYHRQTNTQKKLLLQGTNFQRENSIKQEAYGHSSVVTSAEIKAVGQKYKNDNNPQRKKRVPEQEDYDMDKDTCRNRRSFSSNHSSSRGENANETTDGQSARRKKDHGSKHQQQTVREKTVLEQNPTTTKRDETVQLVQRLSPGVSEEKTTKEAYITLHEASSTEELSKIVQGVSTGALVNFINCSGERATQTKSKKPCPRKQQVNLNLNGSAGAFQRATDEPLLTVQQKYMDQERENKRQQRSSASSQELPLAKSHRNVETKSQNVHDSKWQSTCQGQRRSQERVHTAGSNLKDYECVIESGVERGRGADANAATYRISRRLSAAPPGSDSGVMRFLRGSNPGGGKSSHPTDRPDPCTTNFDNRSSDYDVRYLGGGDGPRNLEAYGDTQIGSKNNATNEKRMPTMVNLGQQKNDNENYENIYTHSDNESVARIERNNQNERKIHLLNTPEQRDLEIELMSEIRKVKTHSSQLKTSYDSSTLEKVTGHAVEVDEDHSFHAHSRLPQKEETTKHNVPNTCTTTQRLLTISDSRSSSGDQNTRGETSSGEKISRANSIHLHGYKTEDSSPDDEAIELVVDQLRTSDHDVHAIGSSSRNNLCMSSNTENVYPFDSEAPKYTQVSISAGRLPLQAQGQKKIEAKLDPVNNRKDNQQIICHQDRSQTDCDEIEKGVSRTCRVTRSTPYKCYRSGETGDCVDNNNTESNRTAFHKHAAPLGMAHIRDALTKIEKEDTNTTHRIKPTFHGGQGHHHNDLLGRNLNSNYEVPDETDGNVAGSRFIGQYFLELWKNQCLCDVRLRVGNWSYLAHKIVLAAFSDYFCPPDPHSMPSICFDIPNATPDAVHQILLYLYTSEMEITDYTLESVLSAAESLGVSEVINLVKEILDNPTPENFEHYLEIRTRHGFPARLTDYTDLVREHLLDLTTSPYFLEMDLHGLQLILGDPEVKVDSECDVIDVIARWIEYSPLERIIYSADLLSFVNFDCIPAESLASVVERKRHVFSRDAFSIFLDAFKNRSINAECQPCTVTSNQWNVPNNNSAQRRPLHATNESTNADTYRIPIPPPLYDTYGDMRGPPHADNVGTGTCRQARGRPPPRSAQSRVSALLGRSSNGSRPPSRPSSANASSRPSSEPGVEPAAVGQKRFPTTQSHAMMPRDLMAMASRGGDCDSAASWNRPVKTHRVTRVGGAGSGSGPYYNPGRESASAPSDAGTSPHRSRASGYFRGGGGGGGGGGAVYRCYNGNANFSPPRSARSETVAMPGSTPLVVKPVWDADGLSYNGGASPAQSQQQQGPLPSPGWSRGSRASSASSWPSPSASERPPYSTFRVVRGGRGPRWEHKSRSRSPSVGHGSRDRSASKRVTFV